MSDGIRDFVGGGNSTNRLRTPASTSEAGREESGETTWMLYDSRPTPTPADSGKEEK